VFKTNNQSVEVTESDEAGFLVALVQASDKDGDSLWYDILGETQTHAFKTHASKSSYQREHKYFVARLFVHTENLSVTYRRLFVYRLIKVRKLFCF